MTVFYSNGCVIKVLHFAAPYLGLHCLQTLHLLEPRLGTKQGALVLVNKLLWHIHFC